MPYEAIQKLGCSYLTDECLRDGSATPPSPSNDSRDSGYSSALSTVSEDGLGHSLYIPAPASLSRDEAFEYHLTTRNVVAYTLGRSVVGAKLSSALVGLWHRLRQWLPGRRTLRTEFAAYLHEQGYLAFAENAEHALACLKFAEETGFRDIWIDAFAHCAGMHARLDLSPEFGGVSKATGARITRASLEMDLHISRVVKALGGFLEQELGPEHLGLSKPARDHLDHFRSFLHSYYVDKLGWFPPPRRSTWDKRPWREMYEDFQALYEYLVDRESSPDWTSNRGVTGGICVSQNVQAFDGRHGYTPLSHPLALLPSAATLKRRRSITSQTALRNFKLGKASTAPDAKLTPYQALTIATNRLDDIQASRPLLRAYQGFERSKVESRLDHSEARKVRWILVYGALQMLSSIMKGPKEVRETGTTSYPVCVLTTGCPVPENIDDHFEEMRNPGLQTTPKATWVPDALSVLEGRPLEDRSPSRISIHPDCEADSAEDYFASNTVSRSDSTVSLNQQGSQSRSNMSVARTGSIRNSMQVSVRSLVGSLNKRNSRRTSLPLEPRKMASYCEIVVEDYGNGSLVPEMQAEHELRPQTAFYEEEHVLQQSNDAFNQFNFDFGGVNKVPLLNHDQLVLQTTGLGEPASIQQSPCESENSTTSIGNADSNRSSLLRDDDSIDTDVSSWDGDAGAHQQTAFSNIAIRPSTTNKLSSTLTKENLCYRPSKHDYGISSMCWSVNAGCYSPTGLTLPPTSRFASRTRRTTSDDTIDSNASSNYPDTSVQAADIEEELPRGRQKSRGMDQSAQSLPPARRGIGMAAAY